MESQAEQNVFLQFSLSFCTIYTNCKTTLLERELASISDWTFMFFYVNDVDARAITEVRRCALWCVDVGQSNIVRDIDVLLTISTI